jgi:hypothetical protein
MATGSVTLEQVAQVGRCLPVDRLAGTGRKGSAGFFSDVVDPAVWRAIATRRGEKPLGVESSTCPELLLRSQQKKFAC